MTPLGEMEQNNEQSNEQSKNMTRTNKNEQINASSESLGILSFIKNLKMFNKKLNCVLRNHVIYSGPVPSVIQDDRVLFIQCTQYTVYINLHLKRCNQLLDFETNDDRLKEILVRGPRPSGSWSPENNSKDSIIRLVFLDIVRYTVLKRW